MALCGVRDGWMDGWMDDDDDDDDDEHFYSLRIIL